MYIEHIWPERPDSPWGIRPTSERSPLSDAVDGMLRARLGGHPARQCVVVRVGKKGEAELEHPVTFPTRAEAEEYARTAARDRPGSVFSVFELVSRTSVPSPQPITTPA